ncbi:MAG TPA: hypothetical protein IAC64_11965 [Candidatus Caccomorpha excrementavium]|nr:hypothetical protein [Candidatus Caccomorpha excrementavium]
MDEKKHQSKTSDKILTALFLVLVFSLTAASILNPVRAYSENENRYLAQMPEFSFESLFKGKFTSDYETFITDQFVMRDSWIGLKTLTERAMLKQDINGVYFGKDGYLIEKHDASDIDEETADRNAQRLADFINQYSAVLGEDRVHAMLVPTAQEILEDKLPPFAEGYDQEAYIEQVQALIPGGNLVDVSDALREHASEYIFYRTDHHWTTLGAYYAYREWASASGLTPYEQEDYTIETVTDEFYGTLQSKVNIKPEPDEIRLYCTDASYSVIYNLDGNVKDTLYNMEALETKDKYTVFLGGNNALVQIGTEADNGRKLLIIKDSFAHCFAPFAADHFEETYMVDFRYFNMPISDFIEEYGITDILVLYNVINFVEDNNTLAFTR